MPIVLAVVAVFCAGIGIYAYRNMNYDKGYARRISAAGFTEKQVSLPDGSVINYGEGPGGGTPLLLIHGQMVSWEDYAKVLPKLAGRFHVYAADCYGHGGSSKEQGKYTAVANGTDLIWFLENVVKEPAIVSGHSSGGLLAAYVAADAPELVKGLVIEDAPCFATEPGRAEKTFAWLGFRDIHDFLNSGEGNFTKYSLEHSYMQGMFGKRAGNGWS